MDERDLASAVATHQRNMSSDGRKAYVESILDAFRSRGESSEDVAEASGAGLEAMQNGDADAVTVLLNYVRENMGLLKEATILLVETHVERLADLPEVVVAGVTAKLAEQ